jgi:hypothetical protein
MSKKLLIPVVSVMIGSSEITDAIHATQPANGLTTQIKSPDTDGAMGERTPATKPIIVTGATAGAAKTLARMLIGEICPDIATMTGVQNTVAANGVAITIASARGIFFEKFSTSMGANNKRPAVARTDNAKPGSRTCQGSATITAPIAKPSAGSESLPRWVPCANNKTDAIAAARSTETDTDNDVTGAKFDIAVPLTGDNHMPTLRALALAGSPDVYGEAGLGYDFGKSQALIGAGAQGPYVNGGFNYYFGSILAPYLGLNTLDGAPSRVHIDPFC